MPRVYTEQICKGDMVLYRGDWFVVTNVVCYGTPSLVDEIQIEGRENRKQWVPVTELRDLEKRLA